MRHLICIVVLIAAACSGDDPACGPEFASPGESGPIGRVPVLEDAAKAQEIFEREYSPELRQASMRGTTQLWVLVDMSGGVERALVRNTSGQAALDSAAVRTVREFTFSEPEYRGARVCTWISVPISFSPELVRSK